VIRRQSRAAPTHTRKDRSDAHTERPQRRTHGKTAATHTRKDRRDAQTERRTIDTLSHTQRCTHGKTHNRYNRRTIDTLSHTPHAHTHRWVVEGATWVKGEYWREGDWTSIDRHTNDTCFRDLALQVCVFVSYRCVSLCQWPGGLVVVHVGAFVPVSTCGL